MTGSEGGGRRPGREHRGGPAAAVLDCLAVLVIVALGLETIWGGNGLERLVLAIVFVTVVPGWALLAIRGPEDLVTRFAVAVGLSLALGALGTTAMVWIRIWSPVVYFAVVAGGAACCLAAAIALRLRRAGTGS